MLKTKYFLFLFSYLIISHILAYNDSLNIDSTKINKWSFGGNPVLNYNSDLGVKYGAFINIFKYGNDFPNYDKNFSIILYNTTKETFYSSLIYNDLVSIPKTNTTIEILYSKNSALDFFGFNGSQTLTDKSLIDKNSNLFYNKFFYTQKREQFRLRLNFERKIFNSKFKLLYGASIFKINLNSTNLNLLSDENLKINTTLFDYYKQWNLISKNESKGGVIPYFKLGINLDTRKTIIGCKGGVWLESYFIGSPKINDNNQTFVKQITTFRYYFEIPKIKSNAMFRLSSQQKLFGNIPSYFLPFFIDSKTDVDGLGGVYNIRGLTRNRLVSDGFLTSNFEIIKPILKFEALKTDWLIDFSIFSDAALITQNYDIDFNKVPQEYKSEFFNSNSNNYILSYGCGTYLRYSTNNVISLNYGRSKINNENTNGLYIGASFMF